MKSFLVSIIHLVTRFGYLILPIKEMDVDMKKELNISAHDSGEVVIVSRGWFMRGEETAKNLGYILQAQTVKVNDYYTVMVFVVKQSVRKKSVSQKVSKLISFV